MNWLRTIPGFVRPLVALFLVAQLAGVVSSPRANAQLSPDAGISHIHHHHAQGQGDEGKGHHHGDESGNLGGHCCGLHAFFAGVLPPAIAIETVSVLGQRFAASADDRDPSMPPSRLDRPPRPVR